MSALRFHATRHSASGASERNLSFEELKNVVNYPDSKQKSGRGAHGGQLTIFRKSVDWKITRGRRGNQESGLLDSDRIL